MIEVDIRNCIINSSMSTSTPATSFTPHQFCQCWWWDNLLVPYLTMIFIAMLLRTLYYAAWGAWHVTALMQENVFYSHWLPGHAPHATTTVPDPVNIVNGNWLWRWTWRSLPWICMYRAVPRYKRQPPGTRDQEPEPLEQRVIPLHSLVLKSIPLIHSIPWTAR